MPAARAFASVKLPHWPSRGFAHADMAPAPLRIRLNDNKNGRRPKGGLLSGRSFFPQPPALIRSRRWPPMPHVRKTNPHAI